MCGQYGTLNEIKKKCQEDEDCKGFTLKNGRPHCLKNKLEDKMRNYTHEAYVKIDCSDEDNTPKDTRPLGEWIIEEGIDYDGYDLQKCGKYNSLDEIKKVCHNSHRCKRIQS